MRTDVKNEINVLINEEVIHLNKSVLISLPISLAKYITSFNIEVIGVLKISIATSPAIPTYFINNVPLLIVC